MTTKPRSNVICANCGISFQKYECLINRGMTNHFCSRDCYGHFLKGAGNNNWKGGLIRHGNDYLRRKLEDGSYAMEHVYQFFKQFGTSKIPNGFHIHHIDFDGLNNDLDNLMLMTDEDHKKFHRWLAHDC